MRLFDLLLQRLHQHEHPRSHYHGADYPELIGQQSMMQDENWSHSISEI